jgi:NAD-dependent deacetylase
VTASYIYNQFLHGCLIPICIQCESILKPDVVLFEEGLPQDIWNEAQNEALEADLILVIGSSLEVYPANTIPQAAIRNGSKLIINNLTATPMDIYADIRIPLDTAQFFSNLIEHF